jgi:2-polyprenyl-3-methyl-5-hydroxy-6-metoxy-1,4-benzoquinol methylase
MITGVGQIEKTDQVREFFDEPKSYLSRRRFDIAIRSETVQEFTKNKMYSRILDIGCGDGSLSLPLLTEHNRLTLLDLSSNMLSRARSKVPAGLEGNVEIIQGNFVTAEFGRREYDLVLCVGVLAHVDSVPEVMAKLASIVKPGGNVILQISDSAHFLTRMFLPYGALMNLVKPPKYPLNRFPRSEILRIARENRLKLISGYRYGLPLPGMHRVFSQEALYNLVRALFGTSARNRNPWLGGESLMLFEMGEAENASPASNGQN